jgi:hypothetical protein
LAQYRACGTYGIPFAFQDRVLTPAATFPTTCTTPSDCHGLPCSGGHCDTSCSTDAQCKVAHPGWHCDSGVCSDYANQEWPCTAESDCMYQGNQTGHCTPKDPNNCNINKICTKHTFTQINDSCHFGNPLNVDFGEQCNPDDNANQDIDNVSGYGPETITIANPAAGKYRAVVRLYADPNGEASPAPKSVTAFLSIYLAGKFCNTLQMPFDKETMYWKAADITWNGAATACTDVVPVPLNPTNADQSATNQCETAANCAFANPFYAVTSSPFDPCSSTLPRSIWCDSAGGDPGCGTGCCPSP